MAEKKKFDLQYLLKGPAQTIEAPNNPNPVECEDLNEVIQRLARSGLPKMPGFATIVGLRIREVSDGG